MLLFLQMPFSSNRVLQAQVCLRTSQMFAPTGKRYALTAIPGKKIHFFSLYYANHKPHSLQQHEPECAYWIGASHRLLPSAALHMISIQQSYFLIYPMGRNEPVLSYYISYFCAFSFGWRGGGAPRSRTVYCDHIPSPLSPPFLHPSDDWGLPNEAVRPRADGRGDAGHGWERTPTPRAPLENARAPRPPGLCFPSCLWNEWLCAIERNSRWVEILSKNTNFLFAFFFCPGGLNRTQILRCMLFLGTEMLPLVWRSVIDHSECWVDFVEKGVTRRHRGLH